LLDIAGVAADKAIRFDGESLPATLLGKSQSSRRQPVFFRRPPDRNAFYGEANLPDLCVREGKWKLLCEYDGSKPQLYDLSSDRSEARNQSGLRPGVTRRLSKQVLAWNEGLPQDLGSSFQVKR
jgi:hypothetical protein